MTQSKTTEEKPTRTDKGYDVFSKLLENPIKRTDLVTRMSEAGFSPTTATSYIYWSKRVVDETGMNPFGFQTDDYKDADGNRWLIKKGEPSPAGLTKVTKDADNSESSPPTIRADISLLVEKFKDNPRYDADDSQHHDEQMRWKTDFPMAIKTKNAEFFRTLVRPKYGNTGQQSHYYKSLDTSDGAARIARAFDHLLNGSGEVSARITNVLSKDGEFNVPGLSEVMVTKALSVTDPAYWVPIFPTDGNKGKRRLLELLSLPVPNDNLARGQWIYLANELLRNALTPYFGNDTWMMMRFLYWLADRDASNVINPGTAQEEDEFTSTMIYLTSKTRNLLLYGPPGTGKTYNVRNFAEHFLGAASANDALSHVSTLARELSWMDALALTLHNLKGERSVSEILATPLMTAFIAHRAIKNTNSTIWITLSEHTDPEVKTVKMSTRYEPYCFTKSADSRWSLTADGVKYVEEELAEELASIVASPTPTSALEEHCRFVTFHQSFAYEEFVEGLKPAVAETGGPISYRIQPGIFKQIATDAKLAWDEAKKNGSTAPKFLLIIDEINRANIAKVFGELITLIEDDKRLGEENELTVTLPYSQQKFGVPPNLYILGTLNTADRSIAQLDLALRRRFTFIEMMPDYSLFTEKFADTLAGIPLATLLKTLNEKISRELDPDHQIGHSYLLVKKEDIQTDAAQRETLHFIFTYKILPLLQEYFYNDNTRLQQLLGNDFFVTLKTSPDEEPRYQLKKLPPDELVDALKKFLQNPPGLPPFLVPPAMRG